VHGFVKTPTAVMRWILCACCLLLPVNIHAAEFDARVIVVMDGDTLMVLHEGKKLKIRLANIDAPELDQAFGRESRLALQNRVLKKQIHVTSRAIDRYGRMIADISLDGRSVNEEQVLNGMAWEYSHYHTDQHYKSLQDQAEKAQGGLWGAGNPMTPEHWRKTHRVTSRPTQVNDYCGKKQVYRQMSSCTEDKAYLARCGLK
jgi:micrococcal nuclease